MSRYASLMPPHRITMSTTIAAWALGAIQWLHTVGCSFSNWLLGFAIMCYTLAVSMMNRLLLTLSPYLVLGL